MESEEVVETSNVVQFYCSETLEIKKHVNMDLKEIDKVVRTLKSEGIFEIESAIAIIAMKKYMYDITGQYLEVICTPEFTMFEDELDDIN